MGLCCREKEGRGKRRVLRVRQPLDIVVGQVETLVEFCRARDRLGTLKIQLPRDQRDGCVCLCCKGKHQESVVIYG